MAFFSNVHVLSDSFLFALVYDVLHVIHNLSYVHLIWSRTYYQFLQNRLGTGWAGIVERESDLKMR